MIMLRFEDNSPEPTLSEHVSMVAAENHNSVFVEPALLQDTQKLADAVIHVTARAIVSPPSSLDLVVGELLVPHIRDLHQSLAVGILLLLGNLDLGQINIYIFVQIPVLVFSSVWVVRVCEGDL